MAVCTLQVKAVIVVHTLKVKAVLAVCTPEVKAVLEVSQTNEVIAVLRVDNEVMNTSHMIYDIGDRFR